MKRFRIPRRQKMFAVLPTLLTLGNAVCGFGAITFAAKVGLQPFGWGKNDTECLWIAAMLVFLAIVFDMLDGRAARWAKQTSQFGAELDEHLRLQLVEPAVEAAHRAAQVVFREPERAGHQRVLGARRAGEPLTWPRLVGPRAICRANPRLNTAVDSPSPSALSILSK